LTGDDGRRPPSRLVQLLVRQRCQRLETNISVSVTVWTVLSRSQSPPETELFRSVSMPERWSRIRPDPRPEFIPCRRHILGHTLTPAAAGMYQFTRLIPGQSDVSFKSLRTISCQFLWGLPGFLFMLLRFQFKAWLGILQSLVLITCPVGAIRVLFLYSNSFL